MNEPDENNYFKQHRHRLLAAHSSRAAAGPHEKREAKEKGIAFDRVIGKSGMLIGKSGTGDR
jgi:hypothetical protein